MSLTGADGVNGNGVSDQKNNDGKQDGDRDASQDKVPAGSGAPRKVTSDSSGNTCLGVNKLEARTTDAVGNVSSKSLGNASPSQKGDDNRNHNKNAGHNDDVAQKSGTDGEDELVAETGKEVQGQNDGQQGRDNQGDEGEGLGQLDNAKAGRSINIEVERVSLNLVVADNLSGDTLKRVEIAGGVQNLLGNGLGNEGGRGDLVVGIRGGVPRNAGSCNGDSKNGQSQEQRDNVEGLERKASHSRCSARRNYIVDRRFPSFEGGGR